MRFTKICRYCKKPVAPYRVTRTSNILRNVVSNSSMRNA